MRLSAILNFSLGVAVGAVAVYHVTQRQQTAHIAQLEARLKQLETQNAQIMAELAQSKQRDVSAILGGDSEYSQDMLDYLASPEHERIRKKTVLWRAEQQALGVAGFEDEEVGHYDTPSQ
jgi:uncharacterized membrane-anchored protein YhcB (DUF1043 family)